MAELVRSRLPSRGWLAAGAVFLLLNALQQMGQGVALAEILEAYLISGAFLGLVAVLYFHVGPLVSWPKLALTVLVLWAFYLAVPKGAHGTVAGLAVLTFIYAFILRGWFVITLGPRLIRFMGPRPGAVVSK